MTVLLVGFFCPHFPDFQKILLNILRQGCCNVQICGKYLLYIMHFQLYYYQVYINKINALIINYLLTLLLFLLFCFASAIRAKKKLNYSSSIIIVWFYKLCLVLHPQTTKIFFCITFSYIIVLSFDFRSLSTISLLTNKVSSRSLV